MKGRTKIKKLAALAAALALAMGGVGESYANYTNFTRANADYTYDYYGYDYNNYDYGYGYDYNNYDYGYGYDYNNYDYGYGYEGNSGYDYRYYDPNAGTVDNGGENTDNTDNSDTGSTDSSDTGENTGTRVDLSELGSTDISEYAEALKDIIGRQAQVEIEIDDTDTSLKAEAKTVKAVQKKVSEIDKEISVLNRSMAALEVEINSNKMDLERTEQRIADGKERLKKRLRAMYLAGGDSYTTVILESDSFYDVLMKMELFKRVAKHDDEIIDELVKLEEGIEQKQAALDARQAEYDAQYAKYEAEKKKLDDLYSSSAQAKALLEKKQEELKRQEEEYDKEKLKFQAELAGILKSNSGDTPFDEQVAATMVLADAKLEELRAALRERQKNDEIIDDYEPTYTFMWPAPQTFNISSGVGARWGTYHQGIDIAGSRGLEIRAADSGTVIMMNNSCEHNYGKLESCGCGGGYGNFVIIDHGNGFMTLYGHMTECFVEVGDKVKQGEQIGIMGTTGFSTGNHLHFEIRYDGYIVNPTYYVDLTVLDEKKFDTTISDTIAAALGRTADKKDEDSDSDQ